MTTQIGCKDKEKKDYCWHDEGAPCECKCHGEGRYINTKDFEYKKISEVKE